MAAPLRSMTGFARARRPLGDGELVVSLKTVNHRGLDIHIHAPSAVDPFENSIRAVLKGRLTRGHVEVRVSLPDAPNAGPALNKALLAQYIQAFRAAATEHNIDAAPDLNAAFRAPGVFGEGQEHDAPAGADAALLEALEAAINELNSFREREGAEIGLEMQRHNAHIGEHAAAMETIRSSATQAFQKRLTDRLSDLLSGTQLDPQRLAQEAAVLADRSDVGEELARLKIHSSQLDVLLQAGGEVGKKLDFLLQEMNRETNTILSKTGGIGEIGLRITDLGLATKSSIEKIREQSLNLE